MLVTITGGSVITIASGSTSGTVSVAAPDEDVYLDSSTVSRSITGATGGNFESLAASTAAASTSITDTIGTTTVSLTADPTIAEGGNITYTASLGATAHGDVLVTITGGSVITIASGSTSGTVSVAAPDEDVYLDSSTVSRSITGATGGNFREPGGLDGGGEHQHHRHHRHHHGEPDGRPGRSPRAATSPTPRAWAPRRTATCW
ncbi:MAG: hypothetical protein IPN05_19880 [Sulfuritalea sp.]|nr:hypothetical protein [Sulfuritalea sp.]